MRKILVILYSILKEFPIIVFCFIFKISQYIKKGLLFKRNECFQIKYKNTLKVQRTKREGKDNLKV